MMVAKCKKGGLGDKQWRPEQGRKCMEETLQQGALGKSGSPSEPEFLIPGHWVVLTGCQGSLGKHRPFLPRGYTDCSPIML